MPSYTNNQLIVRNCWFVDNTTTVTGGGAISIYGGGSGEVIISNCRFENNYSGWGGGAICNAAYNYSYSTAGAPGHYKVTITDCTFRNNSSSRGGAIYSGDTAIIINRCSFIGNSATGTGGAIYDSADAAVKVYSSLFVGNKALFGAAHYAPSPPSTGSLYQPHAFYNCTFATNAATALGGGAYTLWLRGADTLRNCIFWDNSPGTGLDIATPLTSAVVKTNLIQNGTAIPNTTGTVSYNPQFWSPGALSAVPFPLTSNYNYHLGRFSYAVDTGDNITYPAACNLDLESHSRWQGPHPDLGAYEWKSCTAASTGISVSASGPTTFCAPGSVTLTAVVSGGNLVAFGWNGGTTLGPVYTATASGTYQLVALDSNGCRVTVSTVVTAVPAPSPAITISGNTLSVPATYASYQWYLAGVLIPGATAASYSPSANGVYTVKVTTTAGNCPGTSAAYNLRNLAVGTAGMATLRIYPNPAADVLYVEGASSGAVAVLSTVAGQQIGNAALKGGRSVIDTRNLAGGIYILTVTGEDGSRIVQRIEKQ